MSLRQRIQTAISRGKQSNNCHSTGIEYKSTGQRKVCIVGNPNVGKSMIFNSLTGAYVTVSNYPGTTVDISRGKLRFDDDEFEIVDTPGMYSLLPISEEERVARKLLLDEKPDVILHVVNANNLERMIPLTLQLIEAQFPVILDINMMDEAEGAGIEIDTVLLGDQLGIPVVTTVATKGKGISNLRKILYENICG